VQEKNWRFGYTKHVIQNVRLCCQSSDTCTKVAHAGLNYCYDNFEFVRGSTTTTLREAMTIYKDSFAGTGDVRGAAAKSDGTLEIPFRAKL
jgi:hypothetical protein